MVGAAGASAAKYGPVFTIWPWPWARSKSKAAWMTETAPTRGTQRAAQALDSGREPTRWQVQGCYLLNGSCFCRPKENQARNELKEEKSCRHPCCRLT